MLVNKKIIIISLPTSADRRDYITNLFNRYSLEFDFFDAINGKEINLLSLDIHLSKLSPGELGCLYSHMGIYKMMVNHSVGEILILEDDVEFSMPFVDFCRNWKSSSDSTGIDILKLGYSDIHDLNCDQPVGYNFFSIKCFCGKQVFRPVERTFGSFAYLVSLKGASLLLKSMNQGDKPIDILLHESPLFGVNLFIVSQQLCRPNFNFNSLIRENHAFLFKTKNVQKLNFLFFFNKFKFVLRMFFYHVTSNHIWYLVDNRRNND